MPEDRNELSGAIEIGPSSISGNLSVEPRQESSLSDEQERSLRLSPIERVRFGIAVGILSGFGVLMLILVVAFVLDFWFITDMSLDGAIRLITTLSAATSGLVGAVVGYYFGQNSNASIS